MGEPAESQRKRRWSTGGVCVSWWGGGCVPPSQRKRRWSTGCVCVSWWGGGCVPPRRGWLAMHVGGRAGARGAAHAILSVCTPTCMHAPLPHPLTGLYDDDAGSCDEGFLVIGLRVGRAIAVRAVHRYVADKDCHLAAVGQAEVFRPEVAERQERGVGGLSLKVRDRAVDGR